MKRGVPLAPGVVIGRAYCLEQAPARPEATPLDPAEVPAEINRFESASAAAAAELDTTIARATEQLGEEGAAIFRAHRLLLRDPALVARVRATIRDGLLDARAALRAVLDNYAALFQQVLDPYLQERMTDLRDVLGRILRHLETPEPVPVPEGHEPLILVMPQLLPSHVLLCRQLHAAGLLTETGAPNGHAAILARSLGIPAVSGLTDLRSHIHNGDRLVLDGHEGHVYLNPGPEVIAAYRTLQRDYAHLHDRLAANRDQAAVTRDGVTVELLANVNSPADAGLAGQLGAVGVGLYRTEYLYLTHTGVPDEEEQLAVYQAVVEAAPNRYVTLRTLDLGGDKHVPYLGTQQEANPLLGWRSIRLLEAHPELFQTQLRAALRAGRVGRLSLLFPMVSSLEELRELRRQVELARDALRQRGVPFAEQIALGMMLEVPAAAICLEDLLDEVDFVSVGSNDLLQYVMAADRNNPRVVHLCSPFRPALWRLLHRIVSVCVARGKGVTVCGELAGRPRSVLPLLGLGLRSLSMSPAFIPSIKELLRNTTVAAAQEVAEQILHFKTVQEIHDHLTAETRRLWPEVEMVDTRD